MPFQAVYKKFQAPTQCFYIRNFVSAEEEDYLIEQILNSPKPKWTYLKNRRLQNWGGLLTSTGLIPDNDIPSWLNNYINKVFSLPDIFPADRKPNHVLINEYEPGQGIMPHHDGPMYFPTVTTISLGSDTLLDFYRPIEQAGNGNVHTPQRVESSDLTGRYHGSLLLERRSLVVLREELYTKYLHGIAERTQDDIFAEKIWNYELCHQETHPIGSTQNRGTRISITIRNIPKVAKFSVTKLLQK